MRLLNETSSGSSLAAAAKTSKIPLIFRQLAFDVVADADWQAVSPRCYGFSGSCLSTSKVTFIGLGSESFFGENVLRFFLKASTKAAAYLCAACATLSSLSFPLGSNLSAIGRAASRARA